MRRSATYWKDYPDTSTLPSAADYNDIEAALDSLLGPGNTALPVCEVRLTTAYPTLPSGSYNMSGNMTATTDPLNMFSLNSEYRITLPITGRYHCEWFVAASASMIIEADVTKNAPPGTVPATARATYSVFHDARAATGDSAHAHAHGSEVFTAGDYFGMSIYFGATSDLVLAQYGGAKTKMVVRYVGSR